MQEITSVKELKRAIRQLESDQKEQAGLLKDQFNQTVESLTPGNLLKIAFREIVSSPVVMMIGIEKIKSVVHQIIDRVFGKQPPVAEGE